MTSHGSYSITVMFLENIWMNILKMQHSTMPLKSL